MNQMQTLIRNIQPNFLPLPTFLQGIWQYICYPCTEMDTSYFRRILNKLQILELFKLAYCCHHYYRTITSTCFPNLIEHVKHVLYFCRYKTCENTMITLLGWILTLIRRNRESGDVFSLPGADVFDVYPNELS